jgi:hypothetical protein
VGCAYDCAEDVRCTLAIEWEEASREFGGGRLNDLWLRCMGLELDEHWKCMSNTICRSLIRE